METFEAIKGRRSVRNYKKEKLSRGDLEKIIEAGIWAPSGSNAQPWQFFVIDNDELIKKIKVIAPGIFDLPAAMIIICRDIERAYLLVGELGRDVISLMDISMASQNIMLESYDLGIGSCVVRSFGISAMKTLLNLPEHIRPELIIALGYPAAFPPAPKRRNLNEMVFWYGN
jgi:nitroreductase